MRFSTNQEKLRLIVTFSLLTGELARTALGFCRLADAGFGGFLVVTAHLHFTKQTFALHLLFQSAECLIDVIVAHDNFYQRKYTPFSRL